ncbi:MAG: hypothetical protein SFX73_21055 [Kofleriaceae bacterium]|nr:hypothetical protein [Kofleriaceae bacterium]
MQKREYKVLAPIPKANGGEWWMSVGRAYDNVDGSVNLYIDAIPTGGLAGKGLKLQLRVLDEEDLRRREAYRANGAQAAASRTAGTSVTIHAPTADAIPF